MECVVGEERQFHLQQILLLAIHGELRGSIGVLASHTHGKGILAKDFDICGDLPLD
jgi:hypothetical protein